jgi:hypothetical protein
VVVGKSNASSANFISHLADGQREEFYRVKDQRFLGSEEFVEEVQERLGERGGFKYRLSIREIVTGAASDLEVLEE